VRDLIGRVFGGYRLVEPLASGGMGYIFRAESEDGMRRPAVVKVLRGLSPQPHEEARFEREARASLRLRHPNVIETYEFGRTPEGTPYLVMEYLRGRDLLQRVAREGQLDAVEAVRVARGAGAALGYAHAQGVVHRDLKPENIFLHETIGGTPPPRPTGGPRRPPTWTVKVLDFGLALLAEDRVRLTQVGTSLGTPSYMSPEQVRGQHEESAQTDVWGLGAVLYHCLSGRPPFQAETAFGEMVRVLTDEPVPLGTLRPDLPEDLVDAVSRALRKDPAQRFASMADFVGALAALAESGPIVTPEAVAATLPAMAGGGAGGRGAAGAGPDLGAAFAARAAALGDPPSSWGFDGGISSTPSAELAAPLLEEVRLISIVVGNELFDGRTFVKAMRAHGGQGEILAGGRAVGIFGGQHWEGDEPERAVTAALQALAGAPQAGLGVGTGRAVRDVGSAGGAVTGAAVASAERAAVAGAVGVDEETFRRVRGGFSFVGMGVATGVGTGAGAGGEAGAGAGGGTGLGAGSGAGVAIAAAGADAGAEAAAPADGAGRAAHVVRAPKPHVGVIGIRGVGGREIPTVGREREVARLSAALEATLVERTARALLLVGPQGSGKSRLRYELEVIIEERPERIAYVQGRGEPGGGTGAYAAVAHALRRRARIPLGIPRNVARDRLVKLMCTAIADPVEAEEVARFVGEILGANFAPTPGLLAARADAALMRHRVRAAIETYLRTLATQMPLVVAMEDLQWIDPASLELLERLLSSLQHYAVLVVGTTRPDVFVDYPDLLGAAVERVEVGPLEPEASSALLGALLEAKPPPALAARLHRLSGGNPYFLEELALHVRERGADPAVSGQIDLPSTVQGTVQSRLDRLGAQEKELLKRASIYGARFWAEGLAALGAPDSAELLARLRRRELLAAPAVAADGEGLHEWAFRNPIVREVAYGMLTDKQRRRLHSAAARWIAEHLEDQPAEVAAHLEAAAEKEGAAKYWGVAAEQAGRRGDVSETMALSERALERAESLSPRRALRLRLVREEALSFLGRRDDQEGELGRAEALADGEGVDPADRAEVARRWARLYRMTGRTQDAREAAEKALLLAPDVAAKAAVMAERSVLETHAGRLEEGAYWAAEALRAATESGSEPALAQALHAQGISRARQGELSAAVEAFQRAAEILERLGDARLALTARMNVAAGWSRLGRFADAVAALEEVVAASRAAGNRQAQGFGLVNLGLARWRLGAAGALEAENDAIAIARATHSPRMWITALVYRSTIHVECGRAAEARGDAEDARRMATGLKEGLEAEARTALGRALFAAGDARGALAEAVAALAVRERLGGMEELEADLYLLLADVLAALGDEAQAADLLRQGHAILLERAAPLPDADRQRFLDSIPAHRRLNAAGAGASPS
jgi:tetratricopeptide (TPR) repeat protein